MTKQTSQPQNSDPKDNRLLAGLGTEDYDVLMEEAKIVPLKFRQTVCFIRWLADRCGLLSHHLDDFAFGHDRWSAPDGDGHTLR